MSKEEKDNTESKKPKADSNSSKKQKKDLKRYDGNITGLFENSK